MSESKKINYDKFVDDGEGLDIEYSDDSKKKKTEEVVEMKLLTFKEYIDNKPM